MKVASENDNADASKMSCFLFIVQQWYKRDTYSRHGIYSKAKGFWPEFSVTVMKLQTF